LFESIGRIGAANDNTFTSSAPWSVCIPGSMMVAVSISRASPAPNACLTPEMTGGNNLDAVVVCVMAAAASRSFHPTFRMKPHRPLV
jgi:hypothetical protein